MKGEMHINKKPLGVAGKAKGSDVNPTQPNVKEASPAGKAVRMAPKINAEAGGKRVINTEDKPAGRDAAIGKSTFKAPRKEGGMSPTDCGYTKVG